VTPPRATLRLDKWLWQARFVKTRSLAARLVADGKVRLNSARVVKPAHPVGPGDTLTVVMGRGVRVVRVSALGTRRGPASEAQLLYEEIEAAAPPDTSAGTPRAAPGGRPTGRDRRILDQTRARWLDSSGRVD